MARLGILVVACWLAVEGHAFAQAPPAETPQVVTVRPVVERRGPTSTTLTAKDAQSAPGTAGDAASVVLSLPGVARPAVGSGDLVVWGAAPESTRFYFGDVRIPRLFHDGGYRSVLGTETLRSVELVPAAYGAAYGGGLGGLVLLAPSTIEESSVHGGIGADFLDVDVHARAATETLSAFASLRRSHLSDLLGAVHQNDVGQVVPVPQWMDGQVRLAAEITNDDRLELGALGSFDTTTRGVVALDPAANRQEKREAAFGRVWARYERRLEDGGRVTITPWLGRDRTTLENRYGTTPVALDVATTTYAVRAAWKGPVTGAPVVDTAVASLGLDSELASSDVARRGSLTAPPREGDPKIFGRPPSDGVGTDTYGSQILQLAPWAAVDMALAKGALELTLGFRLATWVVIASRSTPKVGDTPAVGSAVEDVSPEPRVAVRWNAAPRVAVKAAVGATSQAPLPEDLSAVFGAPSLGPARGVQGLTGFELRARKEVTLELTAFATTQWGLAARVPTEQPALAHALAPTATGLTYGFQTVLRARRLGRLSGWLSYTMSRSERRDTEGSIVRPSDYDQAHTLTLVATYDLGAGFEVGLRARAATGARRTRVTSAYYDSKSDVWQPLLDAPNRDRLPAFFALDLRISKRFALGSTTLEVYAELENTTNQANAEDYVYDATYQSRGVLRGMPLLPLLGARWAW